LSHIHKSCIYTKETPLCFRFLLATQWCMNLTNGRMNNRTWHAVESICCCLLRSRRTWFFCLLNWITCGRVQLGVSPCTRTQDADVEPNRIFLVLFFFFSNTFGSPNDHRMKNSKKGPFWEWSAISRYRNYQSSEEKKATVPYSLCPLHNQ